MTCPCCRRVASLTVEIDRDGYRCGPKVTICAPCGSLPMELVWINVAQPSPHGGAFKPIRGLRFPQTDKDAPKDLRVSL